jgi:hypothetical protein
MKPERVCEVSLSSDLLTLSLLTPFLKTITRSSLYFTSFSPLLRLIITCLLEKLAEQVFKLA